MINPSLTLLQICDSNFPNGAFSQSFGLETYIQKDIVTDAESFEAWLEVFVAEQLSYVDGLAIKMAYDALAADDINELWTLDRLLTIQNLAKESRLGTQRMGEQMLKITESIFNLDLLKDYRERVVSKMSFGHPAVVFTIICFELKVSLKETILHYLYLTMVGLVQNAVRAIPLGQTKGQKIIYHFQEKLAKTTEKIIDLETDEFGVVSPGLELSQMQHERVGVRIFSS